MDPQNNRDLAGRTVTFKLRDSSQASPFNAEHHDRELTGRVIFQDTIGVNSCAVSVKGWRWAHNVAPENLTIVEETQ